MNVPKLKQMVIDVVFGELKYTWKLLQPNYFTESSREIEATTQPFDREQTAWPSPGQGI